MAIFFISMYDNSYVQIETLGSTILIKDLQYAENEVILEIQQEQKKSPNKYLIL